MTEDEARALARANRKILDSRLAPIERRLDSLERTVRPPLPPARLHLVDRMCAMPELSEDEPVTAAMLTEMAAELSADVTASAVRIAETRNVPPAQFCAWLAETRPLHRLFEGLARSVAL